jgi:hypothetical protein
MKERLIGLFLLICGVVLGYLCIYQPLQSAWNGAPSLSISLKGAIFAPIGLIGLMYLVLGPSTTAIMGTKDRPKPLAYAIMIGCLLLGIGIYFWLRATLAAHGYEFDGLF